MSVISKMRKQFAVWWARNEPPDRYGRYTFAEPVEVACRWDDKSEQYKDRQGQLAYSTSTVYVDRVMHPGDRLMRGNLETDTPSDPLDESISGLASEIVAFEHILNFKGTEPFYTAYL